MGAKRRLELFRKEAQKPTWVRPMTWRDVRFATLKSDSGLSRGFNLMAQCGTPSARSSMANATRTKCSRRCATRDIFTDCEGDAKAIGSSPGAAWSMAGGFTAGPTTTNGFTTATSTTAERDAAQAGDSHAEAFAELERKSDEHFQDMSRAEGRVEECESDLRNALDARHASHYWREHAHERIANLREARAELKRAQHDYAS